MPGDGRYEWDGYFDMDALPEEFNPERGFVATANAMNLPAELSDRGATHWIRMDARRGARAASRKCSRRSRITASRIRWRCSATTRRCWRAS